MTYLKGCWGKSPVQRSLTTQKAIGVHPKQSGSQQRTAVKCGGHKHPRLGHTRKQPQRSKGASSITVMAGNRKTTQQYRQNRAALLEGNPDCYWGCGNKATQADHLIEHDAGGDDSSSNLVPSRVGDDF